jgi:hypothetical protein
VFKITGARGQPRALDSAPATELGQKFDAILLVIKGFLSGSRGVSMSGTLIKLSPRMPRKDTGYTTRKGASAALKYE